MIKFEVNPMLFFAFLYLMTGTQDKMLSQSLLSLAVYVANLFYLTSDTIAPIVEDRSLTDDMANTHNLVVIGGPGQNQWTQGFIDKTPLSLHESGEEEET